MKYSKLVQNEFKNLYEMHYLEPSDISEVKHYYSEGYCDGFAKMCGAMHTQGYSIEDILSLIKKVDPKGESFAHEFYTDLQEEELENV